MRLDSPIALVQRARSFLSGTMLSRISGMGRDITMAILFGSHSSVAAFFVAFRLANLFRRFFSEGALHAAFIPHFEEKRYLSEKEGAEFFGGVFLSLAGVLAVVVVGIEILLVVGLFFNIFSCQSREILVMTAIMLPSLFFISLSALNTALLQCLHSYFLPAITPMITNIIWILAAVILRHQSITKAMMLLSICITFSFFMQFAFTFPSTMRYLQRQIHFSLFRLFTKQKNNLKKLLIPFFFGMVGVGATQINTALDVLFARRASLEGPAYLWYAIRLQQLPLAIFGLALAGATLPALARAYQEEDKTHFFRLFTFSVERSFALMLPATCALIVLGPATLNILFGRGAFHPAALLETHYCLVWYAIGLVPQSLVILLAPAFYARNDFKTATKSTLLAIGLNIFLNSLFVFVFRASTASIACATAISAGLNCIQLWRKLHKQCAMQLSIGNISFFMRMFVATAIAGIATYAIGYPTSILGKVQWSWDVLAFPRDFFNQVLQFSTQSITFLSLFFVIVWKWKIKEFLMFIFPKRFS